MALSKPEWELEQNEGNIEHDLYNSYIMEYTDISGISIDYYFFDPVNPTIDDLYGEDPSANYIGPYKTKVLYQVGDEPYKLDMFGISADDTLDLVQIPKTMFSRDVSAGVNPKAGDLIHTVWNDRTYEISNVGEESSIFQLRKFVWEVILKPFRYSEQSDSADDITTSFDINEYSDNDDIEDESNDIDDYEDVEEDVYGY